MTMKSLLNNYFIKNKNEMLKFLASFYISYLQLTEQYVTLYLVTEHYA
jgi:hypothetical protein